MNNVEMTKRIDLASVVFMKDMTWFIGTDSFIELMTIFNNAIALYKAGETEASHEMMNELFQYQDISGYEIEHILFPDPNAIFYGEFSDEFVKAQELGDDNE